MPKVHEAHRLRPLIELALNEGWIVCSLDDGGLKLVKRGLPPIFTHVTALRRANPLGDWRTRHA